MMEKKKSQLPPFFLFFSSGGNLLSCIMQSCIFALEVARLTYLSLALEKNASWKVYIAAVLLFFSSSRVIVEIVQKQHSCLLNKGRIRLLEVVAENAWSNNVIRRTIISFFYTLLSKYLNHALLLCFILIRSAFTGHCREAWCHLRETWDGRVYLTVNHHVWCGLSGRVRGGNAGWMQSPPSNEAV